jgi:Tfp pilus assembly protein PilO
MKLSALKIKSLPSLDKLELTPSTMLLGLGGILLVAYLVIGISYFQERQEQSNLKEQIEAGGGTLSGSGDAQKTLKDLQQRVAQADDELAVLQNALPEELDSAALIEHLIASADQSDVRIQQMNALPPKEVKAKDDEDERTGYVVLRHTLAVDGSLSDLLDFLSRIEGDVAHTAAVGDLGIVPLEAGQRMTVGVSFYAKPASAEPTPGAADAPQPAPEGGE